MSEEARLREDLCSLGARLVALGLTHGSTGNLSARLPDGSLLVSPTGARMGALDPARLAHLGAEGVHLAGDKPTKEVPLHTAFYDTRAKATGAVVHLHSCHAVALSMLPDVDLDNALPPLTPYGIMQLGKVKILPYFRPGDPAMGEAVRRLAGKRSAVILANHGPVVAGRDLEAAANAMEELEASARLALLTRGMGVRALSDAQINDLVETYDVEWGD